MREVRKRWAELSGSRSSLTPSASSTSALPHLLDAARFPCLATGTPAPAATNAAAVEMLIVCAPSPPVPTMSSTSGNPCSTRTLRSRIARAAPTISSGVSPLAASATSRAVVRIGEIVSSMIAPNARAVSSALKSCPANSVRNSAEKSFIAARSPESSPQSSRRRASGSTPDETGRRGSATSGGARLG